MTTFPPSSSRCHQKPTYGLGCITTTLPHSSCFLSWLAQVLPAKYVLCIQQVPVFTLVCSRDEVSALPESYQSFTTLKSRSALPEIAWESSRYFRDPVGAPQKRSCWDLSSQRIWVAAEEISACVCSQSSQLSSGNRMPWVSVTCSQAHGAQIHCLIIIVIIMNRAWQE